MRRQRAIARIGAAAMLTSAIAVAQNPPVFDDFVALPDVKAWQQATEARRWAVRGLPNQLRPFYRHELMHARSACGLSREQLQKLRPEADDAYARAIDGLERDGAGGHQPAAPLDLDYQEAIRREVDPVVERHVGGERWAALQADRRLRAASRKDAGIDLLVAVLDRELFLTAEQRRAIAASVAAHWEDRFLDPLEVAFNDQSRCPKMPDQVVCPHLTAAQRDVWGRLPQLQGRLWGVTIDHGGDPLMEQELGAARVVRRPPAGARPGQPLNPAVAQPIPAGRAAQAVRAARAAEVRLQAQRLRAVEVQVARPVAQAARPAPPPEEDDERAGGPDAAPERLKRMEQERTRLMQESYRLAFGRRVFGVQHDEARARTVAEAALAHRVDYLRLAGRLSDAQWTKLRAAGRGDIKRYFDRFENARDSLARTADQRVLRQILVEGARTLAADWPALEKVEGPIFTRALERTVTDAHRAAIEREDRDRRAFRLRADVRWTTVLLARSLGLTDDRRRKLEAVMLERVVIPEKFEAADYVIVMFQASSIIPESELLPIFDDLQWRVMRQELTAARRWELYLKKSEFLRPEMFGDVHDAPLPPIRLLAPPEAPARR